MRSVKLHIVTDFEGGRKLKNLSRKMPKSQNRLNRSVLPKVIEEQGGGGGGGGVVVVVVVVVSWLYAKS